MLGHWVALACLCLFSLSALAVNDQDMLKNLRSRLVPLGSDGSLIQSFSQGNQSYVYDQALAVIAFSRAGDEKSATRLLHALEKLQLPDGSLYFSYNLDGTSPYPAEGDRRYAGAIAWVALSATQYQAEFSSRRFVSFNEKILRYLSTEIVNGALRFSPSDISHTAWKENDTAALEHNLDAFAAFRNHSRLNPGEDWKNETMVLRKFILSLWDKNRSHFWSGKNLKTGVVNRDELYLDTQTWSLLALDSQALSEILPRKALQVNCEDLTVEHGGISGFVDSKPTRSPKRHEFVWSEGSLGQILAMEKFGINCGEKSAQDYLGEIHKMISPDGGIAYATDSLNPDFTTKSSVAGTAWMYFALRGFNPFALRETRTVAGR